MLSYPIFPDLPADFSSYFQALYICTVCCSAYAGRDVNLVPLSVLSVVLLAVLLLVAGHPRLCCHQEISATTLPLSVSELLQPSLLHRGPAVCLEICPATLQ